LRFALKFVAVVWERKTGRKEKKQENMKETREPEQKRAEKAFFSCEDWRAACPPRLSIVFAVIICDFLSGLIRFGL